VPLTALLARAVIFYRKITVGVGLAGGYLARAFSNQTITKRGKLESKIEIIVYHKKGKVKTS
jgi:hypothetical protein